MKLAIEGGNKARNTPMPPWPQFSQDEIDAVCAVLASGKVNYWTGPVGREFEQAFASYLGLPHAISVANGTVALELALYALGIGDGDEVIVPSRTFIATASCVVARRARPVVVDIEADSQNISVEAVRAAITPRTRAIIAVHLGGWPCEMSALSNLAREHGLKLVEDCAQAIGAECLGRLVGTFGDAAAFSFCQDKIITTGGEGGMLVLNDDAAWKRAWAYKDHGKGYDLVYHHPHSPGFRWLHESFGTNWRMTELQAVIGRLQLAKLPDWVATRRRNAAVLEAGLAGVPGLRLTPVPAHIGHARYRYYAFLELDRLRPGWTRQRVIEAVAAEGVPCFVGSCGEIYRERAFVDAGLAPKRPLPVAHALGETSLAFLVHPTLTEDDMRDTVAAITKVMWVACGEAGPGC